MVRCWLVLASLAAAWAAGHGVVVPCLDPAELAAVDAVVVALVDVHGGADCDRVKLRSLHKIAAAQQSAHQLNINAPIKLGVHVMDTCGNKRTAVRLAFKSLVYTDPSVCAKPPLMLGYLGPDDADILAAVKQVTGVYKHVHLNAAAPSDAASLDSELTLKIKGISSVLRQLNWSMFSVLHSADRASTLLALQLGTVACVPTMRQMPSDAADPVILAGLRSRAVLVVAPTTRLLEVVRANAALDSPYALVLVAQEAGVVPPLALLDALPEPVVLLQLAPNRPIAHFEQQLQKSYLWDEYLHQQRCNFSTCSVEDSDAAELAAGTQDVAVTAVWQSVAAFGRALRKAHAAKCTGNGRCPKLDAVEPVEWRRRVKAETIQHSPLPPHFDVFHKQAFAQGLHRLTNFTGLDFPDSKGDECQHMVTQQAMPSVTRKIAATTPAPPRVHFEDSDGVIEHDDHVRRNVVEVKVKPKYRDFWADLRHMNTVELVAVLAGFASCIAVALVSCIYCVYSTFKVKGRQENNSRDRRSDQSANRRASTES